ncbi:hypothetical protein AAE02nite_03430 [Adhaeribacter aerolatus]|uniref:Phytase-like domain-containing protein n=1 Tax=Adhaeribacter aerolatus TaxID=670289 RepID=A0A512ASI9_9BACT|nr:hypothetical protein [Adhaeribacter aerolatus]GEO02679.1 hypothetical protein AAE02nite_03430 [Adhaeribacter aerolatus]
MQVTILNKILYQDIPSASGMELIENNLYVIGDDSPFLYVLDADSLKLTGKIELFRTTDFRTGRIPKALKPDLECLTTLTIAGETHLVAFGSGSASNRAKCYTIKPSVMAEANAEVKEYSLEKLYTALQQDTALLSGDLLNLEAAAVTPDNRLILLQRSANIGPNALLQINSQEFIQHLTGNQTSLPSYTIFPFNLPELAGSKARFSGAYIFDDKIFFTASVENTTDAILDGEVMGSFIGWINISEIKASTGSQPLQTALITDQSGQPYKGKVESLVIQEKENQHTYRGLAITDNDNGESELLQFQISI